MRNKSCVHGIPLTMSEYKPSHLVLDKSFFDGCNLQEMETIAQSGMRFIVTAELHVEICTTNHLRKQSLEKLHKLSECIDLLEIRSLYKYELEKHCASSPVTAHFIKGAFNPNFDFEFTDEQTKIIKEEQNYLERESADAFLEIAKEVVAKSRGFMCLDVCQPDVIREVYGRLRAASSRLPESDLLDEKWALYRKVQVDLLGTLDYMQNYHGGQFQLGQERRAHDQVDFRVCIVGALAGALATNDDKVAEYFRTICPSGFLLNPTKLSKGAQ